MNKKFAAFIAIACIIASLAAAGSIAYRVITDGDAGERVAEADFQALETILAEVGTASDLGDGALRARLISHFSSSPTLLAVEVYERGVGTRWRMPSDSPYPMGATEGEAGLPSSIFRLTAPLYADTTGTLAVDALYVRLAQLSVFTAFRDALIALAAFLALASIAMAIAARPRVSARGEAVEEAASAAAAYQYETLSPDPASRSAAEPDTEAIKARAFEETFERREGERHQSVAAQEAEAPESEHEPERLEPGRPGNAAHQSSYPFAEEEDEGEAEFDVPEIDFMEDGLSRPSAAETGFEEPLPDLELPSEDWMGAETRSDVPEGASARDGRPAELDPSAGTTFHDPASDIEELEAFDLEAFDLDAPVPADGAPTIAEEKGSEGGDRLGLSLDEELDRAASEGRDLSLVCVTYDELTPAMHEYSEFRDAIRKSFGAEGSVHERGRSGFAAILPGIDSGRALRLAEGLFKSLAFLSGGDAAELLFQPLYIGISSRAGRPVDSGRLLAEAEAAQRKAREDTESHIVAFKADPERYRRFVSTSED